MTVLFIRIRETKEDTNHLVQRVCVRLLCLNTVCVCCKYLHVVHL